ncbi:sulfite exporter TauE/SafE family protein [Streptomyces sp. NPDC005811]|uniref:urease accessory protein UreH domain-containing protein n=1 Tax=Streptomyces sp. NPDC005811 TaxID=3154565 RepID=UPI0033D6514B
MRTRRLFASCAAVFTAGVALALAPSTSASAHPLGNFTVNRYDGLVAAPGQLRVDHVEDLAEIPATQAKPDLKRLGTTEWARQRCESAASGSRLTVDGEAVPLTAGRSKAVLRPGQAGLNTLRVECRLTAELPEKRTFSLSFHSEGASTGPGWREITARGDRMTLTESDVPQKSVSDELTTYPKELLSSPADTATAALTVRPGGSALAADDDRDTPAASVLPRGADRWTRALDNLVARQDLTVGFAALALVIAIVLGAMHAVAPGHGKTIMAATAAARGGKARMKDVLPLAASVTITHTLGVVALGLLVTAGSAAAPSVIAWLGLASGALVLCAGVTLARRAWRNRGHGHSHGGHTHGHGHDHDHGHPHDHSPTPSRELVLAGAPATRAHSVTEKAPAPHDHGHKHGHEGEHDHHPEHTHDHDHDHKHDHGHAHDHSHTHGGHTHTHGGHTHTHEVAPTLRGTILLGFAGGMVPSPSAVVVLVGAAALGHAWFGLLLVVAYGIGLALTLTAAGFAVVRLGARATRLLDRRPSWTTHPVLTLVQRNLPVWSALLVVALGAGLVLKGAASVLG